MSHKKESARKRGQPVEISYKEALSIKDPFERGLAQQALLAGLRVFHSHSIRAPHPVKNKYGEIKKVVHTPDFILMLEEPSRTLTKIVEVGRGRIPSASKLAQQRVVEAAGVDNWMHIKGHQIRSLVETRKQSKLRKFKKLLQWK